MEVVGLVRDALYRSLSDRDRPAFFLPIRQNLAERITLEHGDRVLGHGEPEATHERPCAACSRGVDDGHDGDPAVAMRLG